MDSLRGRVFAMMDITDVSSILAEVFHSKGLAGRGRCWSLRFDGIKWIICLDRLTYGQRLGIDIGLWIAALGGDEPVVATHCPVLCHADTLLPRIGGPDQLDIVRALELDADIDNRERIRVIRQLCEVLAGYVGECQTLDSVRAAYRRGDFAAAAIRKDARILLDAP
jgi:hypothetical protein